MNLLKRIATIIGASSFLILTSCAEAPSHNTSLITKSKNMKIVQKNKKRKILDNSKISEKIMIEYQKWQGTPYQYGGLNKKGVDCSGLVQNIFNHSFNYSLPRTTTDQIKIGSRVYKKSLEPGDLVFFQMNKKTKHVGIYVKEGMFMHASLSKGVMLSSLENEYWKKRYKESRRPILDKIVVQI